MPQAGCRACPEVTQKGVQEKARDPNHQSLEKILNVNLLDQDSNWCWMDFSRGNSVNTVYLFVFSGCDPWGILLIGSPIKKQRNPEERPNPGEIEIQLNIPIDQFPQRLSLLYF